MSKHLNLAIPLRARLANIKAGRAYCNDAWGRYTPQVERGAYHVANGTLRGVGWCDEIARHIDHKGWFTDREFQDEVMRGAVYALPAKNGKRRLVAGYVFTGGDDGGVTLYFDELFSDETEAARMADGHARAAADNECDYQDKERERIAAEEAEEARLDNLAECHPPLYVEA